MPDYTVTVIGLDETRRRTGHMANGLPGVIRATTYAWGAETVQYHLAGQRQYPPPPANSTYVRTYVLANGWTASTYNQLGVRIENRTEYAGYVVGRADQTGQARIHSGRWWLFAQRIIARLPRLHGLFHDNVTRFWNGG